MTNHYESQVRDADMEGRKAGMMAELSHALTEVGGNGMLDPIVEAFIESCARNGIRLSADIRTGPYALDRDDRGREVYGR